MVKRTLVAGALAAGASLLPQMAMAADSLGIAAPIETLGNSFQAGFYAMLIIAIIAFVIALLNNAHGLAGLALMFCFVGAIGSNAAGARDLIFQGAAGAEIEPGQIVVPLRGR
jgi:hypothetical protein